jgi:stage III sporulation protein SpoIIIAA
VSVRTSGASDDLDALLRALPPEIAERLRALPPERDLIEVILDLGRQPAARFGQGGEEVLLDREVEERDIRYVVDHIGSFGDDNRAGIGRTLHRISAIRNRAGKIVGLTCRIGRAVFGTIEIIDDLVESGRSILIMGRPGIGKTTMLREAARVLADDLDKRVVVVDTSNEIAGDGDIPHPGIGRARRMQVGTPSLQHAVMIEAVENHMPEVIVIDEIGTELEAQAARTIAERGVQLIGTAHGNSLDNLMMNPTLSDLIGGIQSVTLGDEEARRRRTQKSVLERKAPPTFDCIVEIQDRDRVAVHEDVAETVDALLRGDALAPELRWRDEGGVHRTQARTRPTAAHGVADRFAGLVGAAGAGWRTEPGWRGGGEPGWRGDAAAYYETAPWAVDRGALTGYSPGATGGWRLPRGKASKTGRRSGARTARDGGASAGRGGPLPGPDGGAGQGAIEPPQVLSAGGPFRLGDLADRGPLERGTDPGPRARDVRELERHRDWRSSAVRALSSGGASADASGGSDAPSVGSHGVVPQLSTLALPEDVDRGSDAIRQSGDRSPGDDPDVEGFDPGDGEDDVGAAEDRDEEEDEAEDGDEEGGSGQAAFDRLGRLAPDGYLKALPTIRVLGFGISRKRLEQAIRELQLPVIVARDVEETDVVITLRTYYRQKPPAIRDAEERALPIYVLKSNTIIQMEACLTSLYAIQVDPREAALQETEEAIGLVLHESRTVELSPQNAYVRRLQHQLAERANVVSQSKGREPFRRVRLYPDKARAWR